MDRVFLTGWDEGSTPTVENLLIPYAWKNPPYQILFPPPKVNPSTK